MIKARPKYSTDLYGTIFTSIILDRLREDDTNGGYLISFPLFQFHTVLIEINFN
jgi:hypothetical protein